MSRRIQLSRRTHYEFFGALPKMKKRKLNYPLPDWLQGQEIQVLTKYQDYSAELLRLALLLLAAYGFVLQELVSSKGLLISRFQACPHNKDLVTWALISLCISAATALAQRLLATSGYEYRLAYARLGVQFADVSNTQDEMATIARKGERAYSAMQRSYFLARCCIGMAAVALGIGTAATGLLIWTLWPTVINA